MKKRIKKLIAEIKIYRKTILFYFYVLLIIVFETAAILLLYFLNLFQIKKEMLYWLFSASSQSMAALFAVVGMFAVFRHQILDNKLRNLYDVLKNKFQTHDWIFYFGGINANCWEDEVIANNAEYRLTQQENRLPHNIKLNLRLDILEIRSYERARDSLLIRAKIPLISVLATFLAAIISLAFTESISNNIFGLIIFIVIIAAITFSMIMIFFYLITSISPRKKKK